MPQSIRAASAVLLLAAFLASQAETAAPEAVADTALVIAVDVSQSVDENRYHLQMEGIAQALEDKAVIDVILSGPKGAVLVALVAWSDQPKVGVPWTRVASVEDARRVAGAVRALPHIGGEFTCVARLLRYVKADLAPEVAGLASRDVLDESSDGIDNCGRGKDAIAARDALLDLGATINGLPIFVKGENDILGSGAYRMPGYDVHDLTLGPDTDTTTLDAWFETHVIGGPGAFLLPAQGYEDFGRAIRRKFVVEISGLDSR